MTRAIELAWRGWGRVSPNPMVGAVVLQDGQMVGEGWHAEFGQRHAEPVALEAAGSGARGATLVVTLEPCAHQGKQPPCVDAVLAAGVRRVVTALADPNPLARGGAARLRESGVEVECGLLAAEAAAQNAIFLASLRDQVHDAEPRPRRVGCVAKHRGQDQRKRFGRRCTSRALRREIHRARDDAKYREDREHDFPQSRARQ
jgi:diaminohydroxyphosphoribosylaminopyrimidine deaminase/5-amino-6-(5-phosphoribosylamino)uracil reductase